jgi:ankyrin repeat protein
MAAADSGNLVMVQWLVAHGAAASVRSRQGLDAAELAERRGHREVADWLRRAGK